MLVALKVKSIKKKQTFIRDLLNKKLFKHYVLNSKKDSSFVFCKNLNFTSISVNSNIR